MASVKLKGMDHRSAQMVLASTNYYKGAIDGDIGPATMSAVRAIERNSPINTSGWTDARRVIGAVQRVLDMRGYEPGLIDGYAGHNTQEALTTWLGDRVGSDSEVRRDREPPALVETVIRVRSSVEQLRYPVQADLENFYGPRGSAAATRGKVTLPIPFYLSWNVEERITGFSCHEKVAVPFQRIFEEAVRHYGESEYRRLRLDLYGGCFNNRAMRGGSKASTHAYGVAIDLDPERNQLRWDDKRASFAKPEYIPFWNIVVSHGATPAGYAWNGDWMHFQFARLR